MSVFLITAYQHNSLDPTFSNICIYCILPCLNRATENPVWLSRILATSILRLRAHKSLYPLALYGHGSSGRLPQAHLDGIPEVTIP